MHVKTNMWILSHDTGTMLKSLCNGNVIYEATHIVFIVRKPFISSR